MAWELASRGIDQGIFQDEHSVAAFHASNHTEPRVVKAAYADMELSMGTTLADANVERLSPEGRNEQENRHCGAIHQEIIKKICLTMQGSWLIKHQYTWSTTDSPCMDNVLGRIARY